MEQTKISIIGAGKLGLCLALNLERAGYFVIAMDVREDYIHELKTRKYKTDEPGVEEFLRTAQNLQVTTSLARALSADVIFICVDTPSTPEYRYDHSKVGQVICDILEHGPSPVRKEIVINCTTFPGYCESLAQEIAPYNYFVSYNPEFIAQGSIMRDQVQADQILIGQADPLAGKILSEIYYRMCGKVPVKTMTRTEAELTKLAVNCFLTTKISFANMIGDIALRYDCDPKVILGSVGSDSRIGAKYLNHGFGFGGPCFPRDNRALSMCAEDVGIDAVISRATDEMNFKHLDYQIDQFLVDHPDKSIPVEMEYLTYKRESTILEESQQLEFALRLQELGYTIKVLDTRKEVTEKTKNLFN